MSPQVRRAFGYNDDPASAAGGSNLEALTGGAIPDVTKFWPVTGGSLEWQPSRIERNNEVRGRRAVSPPIPFRVTPMQTIPTPAYRSVIEKALKLTMGSEAAVVGTSTTSGTVTTVGAPYTHILTALGFGGATPLPTIITQLVNDDINRKMTGSVVERAAFNFPLDAEGTVELELHGLYAKQEPASLASPTPVFTDLSLEPYLLRDAKVFFDGGASAALAITAFTFTWVNNIDFSNRHYAGHNIESKTIGAPPVVRKLWFPHEHKLGAAQDVTYGLNFSNANELQELAHEYGQLQKIVVELGGPPIPGASANELIRFTMFATEHTGGGVEALTARGDVQSSYQGGAYYSDADASDVKVEVVNGSATPI